MTDPGPDAKQARDLVSVLQEAKQQIDPRLAEMVRYGGGGGGGGRFGGYRGRGGGGHRGSSPVAQLPFRVSSANDESRWRRWRLQCLAPWQPAVVELSTASSRRGHGMCHCPSALDPPFDFMAFSVEGTDGLDVGSR